jgi:hypothetical protein
MTAWAVLAAMLCARSAGAQRAAPRSIEFFGGVALSGSG